jgi:hypothetical protein
MKRGFMQDKDYITLLTNIKQQVLESQHRAAMSVNGRLLFLYWQIGHHILEQQEKKAGEPK